MNNHEVPITRTPGRFLARFLVLALSVALASGCEMLTPTATTESPDGRTITGPAKEITKMEYEWARTARVKETRQLVEAMRTPPDTNMSAEGEVAFGFAMYKLSDDLPGILDDGTGPYDVDIVKTQERHRTGRFFGGLGLNWLLWGGNDGGDRTTVNVGNRSTGGGKASHGGSVSSSASGDSEFDGLYINTGKGSPFQVGDGQQAGGKDSQIQTGDGTQGQAVTRPTNQPQPQTEGGPINNNSEGLGFDGSL